MVSVPRRNGRRLIQGDKIILRQIKSYTEISNDKLFYKDHSLMFGIE